MAKLNNYKGTISLIAGIAPTSGSDYAMIEAHAIQIGEDDKRLDVELEEINENLENIENRLINESVKNYKQIIESGENFIITRLIESGLYLLKSGSIISFVRSATENNNSLIPGDVVNALKVYVDTEVIISPYSTLNTVVSAFVNDKRSVYIHQGSYIEGESLSQSLINDNTYIYEWSGTVNGDGTEYTYTATLTKQSSESGGGNIEVDQTYRPESSNAQSGKAVAEAISKIPTGDVSLVAQITDGVLFLTK